MDSNSGTVVEVRGGTVVVRVVGEVDLVTVEELRAALESACESAVDGVELDLRRVDYFGSEGVHALNRAWGRARKRGIDFRLVGAAPPVAKVLAIVGFDWLTGGGPIQAEPAPPVRSVHS